VAGEVEFGRLGLDGSALVPLGGALIKHRHRISASGSAVATLVMARDGRLLADPQVTLHGLVDPEADGAALGSAAAAVRSAIEALNAGQLADDAAVKEAARLAVRRYIHAERGKKPLTDVHLVRV
jgi:ribonuclease J